MPPSPPIAETKRFLAGLEQQARGEALAEQQLAASWQEAFRWGRRDRRTWNFQPPARSADAAIYESGDLMHRRTRSEVLNNAQIKRIREAIEDLIVGPGMQTFADPFDPTLDITDLSQETLDPLLQYALEADEAFEEWFCEPGQFDVAGKLSGPDMQRMAAGECVERGGMLIVRTTTDRPGQIVPRCYQAIEYDQLDHTKDRPAGSSGGVERNRIINGIELDSLGREVAFHIYDDHPFDDFIHGNTAGKSSRVSAERVIHLCLFKRPSQSLGFSWLAAVGQAQFDRDGFVSTEIQTARKAALMLLVHYAKNLKNPNNFGLLDGMDDTDPFGNQELKVGSSTLAARVHADDKVELVENVRPTSSADSFISILDHDTAGGVGLSYYTLSGRYEQTSFTAVRGALLAEDSHFKPLQNWFAARLALPIRRDFHRQAIALGKLKSVTAETYLANPRRYERFDAIGAGRDLLDPEGETNALTGLLRSCLTTLKQACARKGQHWIRVLRQIALENRLLDLLDISLDLSKGQGGQTVGNTRSKQDQRDAQQQQATGQGQSGNGKTGNAQSGKARSPAKAGSK